MKYTSLFCLRQDPKCAYSRNVATALTTTQSKHTWTSHSTSPFHTRGHFYQLTSTLLTNKTNDFSKIITPQVAFDKK